MPSDTAEHEQGLSSFYMAPYLLELSLLLQLRHLLMHDDDEQHFCACVTTRRSARSHSSPILMASGFMQEAVSVNGFISVACAFVQCQEQMLVTGVQNCLLVGCGVQKCVVKFVSFHAEWCQVMVRALSQIIIHECSLMLTRFSRCK